MIAKGLFSYFPFVVILCLQETQKLESQHCFIHIFAAFRCVYPRKFVNVCWRISNMLE